MRVATITSRYICVLAVSSALLAPSGARAISQAECTPVRMDQGGGSVSWMPIRSQEDAGVCFAYTAVQLADAWRFRSRGTRPFRAGSDASRPHLSSPLPVYFGVARDERRLVDYEGGLLSTALNHMRSHGSCSSERVIDPALSDLAAREARVRRELMDTFDEYMRLLTRRPDPSRPWETLFTQEMRRLQIAHPEWTPHRHSIEAKYNLARPLANDLCLLMEREGLPLPQVPANNAIDSHRVIAALLATTVEAMDADTGFADRYLANVCRNDTEPLGDLPALIERHYNGNGTEAARLESELHARLSRPNPLPVVADFCTNVLTMPEPYRGMASAPDGDILCARDPDDPEDDGKSRHSILVIGRRWNAARNTCQVLLRNSWGETCDGRYTGRAPWSCSGDAGETRGQIWIDSDDLAANTFRLNYLQE